MTLTELLNLKPGQCVLTIYGMPGIVLGHTQNEVILNINNTIRECCKYYRDYEIKCLIDDDTNKD